MGRREAAAGDEDVGRVADDQRPVGDADRRAVRQVRARSCRRSRPVVVLDRGAAQADRVVEGPSGQDVVAGQSGVAVHAPGLADTDPRAERRERGAFVAGHAIDEEADVLERLAAAGDLGLGQEPRVGRVDDAAVVVAPERVQAGHDRRGHAVDGRLVVAALAARQVVPAGRGGLGHERVEAVLRDGPAPGQVHVDHPERRRERLGRVDVAGRLEPEPGERAQVGVAGGIDEGSSRARARDPPASRRRWTRPVHREPRRPGAWRGAGSATPASVARRSQATLRCSARYVMPVPAP